MKAFLAGAILVTLCCGSGIKAQECTPDLRVTPTFRSGWGGECGSPVESATEAYLQNMGATGADGEWWSLAGVTLESRIGGILWFYDLDCHLETYCTQDNPSEPVCYDYFYCPGISSDAPVLRYFPCRAGETVYIRSKTRWERDGVERATQTSCEIALCCPLLWVWVPGSSPRDYTTNATERR